MLRTMWGCCIVFLLVLQAAAPTAASHSLKVGFYEKSCPQAQNVVRDVVSNALAANKGIGAGLIRLHFHDCFVRGCDASVLLEGRDSERMHPANLNSLRGFEVVEGAKDLLESQCPNTVSCADVLAFAARDAAELLGGFRYKVPAGRRDGRISRNSDADVLPPPTDSAETLRDRFAEKGLSLEDMVALSGAHSLGVSHCPSFSTRLYNFNATHPQDPSMDADLADYLKRRCPPPGTDRTTVSLDLATPNRLDVQYYRNLQRGRGLFTSDQTLWTSSLTADKVASFAEKPNGWAKKYAAAMVRMGAIDVLTGNEGEIRVKCAVVNGL
ncbi:unnamed protein product [Spirodela intermedia]|uniref:Peroxidase n=1 Tax=Spirodela intermedia TaxID=51605 RepID=A0A7I8KQJ9_SPIIN|nr:unnamed protein product [Spirodela intermedia]CAA7400119.1 unnamed protein product [Spirodela intermedia]CAA7400120.1 unnamed protein product [Spirodela intermedia]